MNHDYATYKKTGITTSAPMKIVLLCYDGAIGYLSKSIEFAHEGDTKNRNIYANKARDIIVELNNALNTEIGGEIAQSLRKLYFFMDRHLIKANWKNEVQPLKEVLHLLTDLREAWQGAYDHKRFHAHQEPSPPALSGLRA
jgi:flagellar protein FliS